MRKNNGKKKQRKNLSGLFYNDRFVMLFSVVAAVVLWFVIAASDTESDTGKTISDIPIQITLSDSAQQDGLKIFDKSGEKASVTVRGNWLTVSEITKDDIQVTARQSSSIDQPGTYPLQLTARSQSMRTNYEIVQDSLDPQMITVKVDRLKEEEFTVEDNINYNKPEGYIGVQENFTPAKVTVSGPESDVEKIARIVAEYRTDDIISESQTITADLVFYDDNGDEIPKSDMEYVTLSEETVQVDINILKKAEIPVKATFSNKPAGFNDSTLVTVNPATLEVGLPERYVDVLQQVELDPIDFTSISPDQATVNCKIKLPSGCKNLSNADNATVTLNLSGYSMKEFQIPDSVFTVTSVPDGYSVTPVSKSVTVQVVGPTQDLDTLTEENFTADISLKDKEPFDGHKELAITIGVKGNSNCWIYKPNGEDYKVSVNMESTSA